MIRILLFMLLYVPCSGQQAANDSIISFVFKGNAIKARVVADTLHLKNPSTGEWGYKLQPPDTIPFKVNGKDILDVNQRFLGVDKENQPKVKGTTCVLTDWLTQCFHYDIEFLEKIGYEIRIKNVVVDDNGHIAYYTAKVAKQWNFKNVDSVCVARVKEINKNVADSLDRIQLIPATYKGKPTPVYINWVLGWGWVF